MLSKFKNMQFPVKTTQQLSQMLALKQWQERFLWTFISTVSAYPLPISEDGLYKFSDEVFYIYV